MELEDIMLSEVIQVQEDKYHMFLLMYKLKSLILRKQRGRIVIANSTERGRGGKGMAFRGNGAISQEESLPKAL